MGEALIIRRGGSGGCGRESYFLCNNKGVGTLAWAPSSVTIDPNKKYNILGVCVNEGVTAGATYMGIINNGSVTVSNTGSSATTYIGMGKPTLSSDGVLTLPSRFRNYAYIYEAD